MTKVVFFGNERLISGLESTETPILRMLIDSGYDVVAVVANDSGTRSRKPRPLEVAELANANTIPVHLPIRPMDIYDELKAYGADIAVLVAYGRIVPQAIIDIFPKGIVNVHPSRLPNYRGPSPIESTIANGDQTTAVSIMSLEAKMDAGPVYSQIEYPLFGDETAPELCTELAQVAATELHATLPSIIDGSLTPEQQDDSKATYCKLIEKSDGRLNPETQTAQEAERLVRAYIAFPKTRLNVEGHDVIVLKAHVSTERTSPLDVAFTNDYLSIDELQAPSGKKMNAEAFVKGYLR